VHSLLTRINRLRQSSGWKMAADILPDLVMAIGFLWLVILIILKSWVSEDAYITFRVIDNFMQGYGLRWNIYERVQVYTHPLWMLLHIPLYALWHNLFLNSIVLSVVFSTSAIMLTLCSVKKPIIITVICFFLPLLYSKTFIDYTSSGLENPLSFLLFAWFGFIMLHQRESRYFWFLCSLSVALAMFNRLDTIIVYAPALAWLGLNNWRTIHWRQVVLGASPLLCWFAFSLLYYGFLFPNTKYAKLNTDMRFMRYLYHSMHYIKYFVVMDTMSAAFVLLTPAPWLVLAWRAYRKKQLAASAWFPATIALGVYGYCLYVVYIGGDYMIGRFWAFPMFVAVWLFYVFMPTNMSGDKLFCLLCAMIITYIVPNQMLAIKDGCNSCVIGKAMMVDAIATFRANKMVINRWPLQLRTEGQYQFAYDGKRIASEKWDHAEKLTYIGMMGFYAGPTTPIIDELALTDPLLARLPASKSQNFHAGHFRRDIPNGYPYAIDTGDTSRMNPALAKYYEKLRLITSGNLFDPERLKTILYFNLGVYDHWKQDYLTHRKP